MAALLFKLNACTLLDLNKVACTSKLCSWKKSRKRAYPAPLRNLDFKRPKKDQNYPRVESPFKKTLSGFSSPDPIKFISASGKMTLDSLRKVAPNAAVFTSVSLWTETSDGSNTDTADETEINTTPELLTSFFFPSTVNNSDTEIMEIGKKKYDDYLTTCTQNQFDNLARLTATQSLNEKWMLHRAGRITASNCKNAFSMDVSHPSISTINAIMQYKMHTDTPATLYGKQMEDTARKSYFENQKHNHIDFNMKNTGLNININFPFLGASPDGFISCSCHGKGVLEIKCPYKYKKGLKDWKHDKLCPVTFENKMKENHQYFYQIQLQMLVTETDYCDFFVWSQGDGANSSFLLRITKNLEFCKKIKEKLEIVFHSVILPELVSRKSDPENNRYQQLYCYCKRPSFPPMIGCDGLSCKIEWFHYACANVTRAPARNHKWYCPDCIKLKNI